MQGLRQAAENVVHKEETTAEFRRTAVRFIFFFFFFFFLFSSFIFLLFFRLQSSSTHAMEWNNVA